MLGTKIKQLRIEKGLSQTELGEKLQVTQQSVAKWEKGSAQPNMEMITRLCGIFEVDPNYLLGHSGEEASPMTGDERKLLLLARKAVDIPPQQRQEIIDLFEKTIDLYLKAKGMPEEKDE
ncbi:helix-turn-helix transcriptional regulator [Oscillospiraceae bacterium MB08-C2-2]|nr:helix-turn-helix transcriptional regulator [Oscillospiraceae bacterium MB08-C2-2]